MSLLVPSSVPHRTPTAAGRVVGWSGEQGAAWAKRNPQSVAELDASYLERFGISRTDVNRTMLARVPRTARVLEVGCSAGNQLDALAAIGFSDLTGVDLSAEAMDACRWPHRIADACDLPYKDGSFDLVMTSGTLMHIPPARKQACLSELLRVSGTWYYGCEMWTPDFTQWDFGDLIPPAWTMDWYAIAGGRWPLVERMHLEPVGTENARPLACFLLEKA